MTDKPQRDDNGGEVAHIVHAQEQRGMLFQETRGPAEDGARIMHGDNSARAAH